MTQRPFAADRGWQYAGEPGAGPVMPNGSSQAPAGASTDQLLRAIIESGGRQEELLAAILQELREQVPQGIVIGITQSLTTTVPVEVPFSPALFNLGITNDGPGVVLYRVPNRGGAQFIAINPTEVLQFNIIKGKISSIGLNLTVAAAPGVPTVVRLVGLY